MRNKVFEVTADHIKLLRKAYISWNSCEFGAPCIDPKRPYGNGGVVEDMAKILGIPPVPTDDEEIHYPPGTSEKVTKIHKELETVLQIVLRTGCSGPGRYIAQNYLDWEKE